MARRRRSRAHNQDIDYVTIRNLVIRNMPQQGIHAYYWMSDHWTIEYNEIASTSGARICAELHHPEQLHPPQRGQFLVVDCGRAGGAYLGNLADNATFDSNEIAYNGREQKVGRSANVDVPQQLRPYTTSATASGTTATRSAGARHRRQPRGGQRPQRIFFEASIGATISNNTLRRNPWDAVMISMSQNAQIYNNTLEGNFGGIEYFLNCDVLVRRRRCQEQCGARQHGRPRHAELHVREQLQFHLLVHVNTACAVSEWIQEPDLLRDTYRVPSLSWDRYFLWGGWKGWVEWQVLGQDAGGSLTQ
jgi:parallel beta-helix repeat protein